jgi:hypothetical protein
MKDSIQPVSEIGMEIWLEASEAYASQLGSLFESMDSMRERMRAYWLEERGIRFWSI